MEDETQHPAIKEFKTEDGATDLIFKILVGQVIHRISDEKIRRVTPYKHQKAVDLYYQTITKNNIMYFKDAKFPDFRWFPGWGGFPTVYGDSMLVYHLLNSDYCEKNVAMIENIGGEGPYGFDDVRVRRGDNVIDAGAYIGDWSAIARAEGGNIYAFEPSDGFKDILNATAQLNNFEVISAGLGNFDGYLPFNNKILPIIQGFEHGWGDQKPVMKIDTFAKERNIHIDFIKSDIEGYELELLKGARDTLLYDEPKLAIRTYHHAYDDRVLSEFVKSVNPKYKIYRRKKTMYGEVN